MMTEVRKVKEQFSFSSLTSRTWEKSFKLCGSSCSISKTRLSNSSENSMKKLYENPIEKNQNKNISHSLSWMVRSVNKFNAYIFKDKYTRWTLTWEYAFQTMLKTKLKVTETEKYKGNDARVFVSLTQPNASYTRQTGKHWEHHNFGKEINV